MAALAGVDERLRKRAAATGDNLRIHVSLRPAAEAPLLHLSRFFDSRVKFKKSATLPTPGAHLLASAAALARGWGEPLGWPRWLAAMDRHQT